MNDKTVFTLFGVLVVTIVAIVAILTVDSIQKTKTPTQTSVYWLCNKDQVSEILVNSPNGMSAAIATHCELHTYGRKM